MIMRNLTSTERELIRKIAERLPSQECETLLCDLSNAIAKNVPGQSGRVQFNIVGYQRPAYRGQHPFPVEGKVKDRDGEELTVLLHADENGRLLELELIRFDASDVLGPDWSTLQLW
jgi:hypothetical protein